jgi:hypothetical protein
MGTFNAREGEPLMTRRVSAGDIEGAAMNIKESPARAALKSVFNVM